MLNKDNRLQLPKRKDFPEFEEIYKISESIMGFLPNSMLYMSKSPELLMSFLMLSKSVLKQKGKIGILGKMSLIFKFIVAMIKGERKQDTLGQDLRWFVAYAASYAAGCRYCKAHSSHSLSDYGISQEKFEQFFRYHESNLYSDRERSAIAIGLSAGSVPNSTNKTHFINLKKYFNDNEMIEIISIIALFGFLNRWNDTLGTPLEEIFS
jgi:alkylhydroperoxidase family enzyme